MEAEGRRKLLRRLRKATRQLGRVRELDVLLALLEELGAAKERPDGALRRMVEEIRGERVGVHKPRVARSAAAELERLQRKLGAVAEDLRTPRSGQVHGRGWRWALEARVARRAAALRTRLGAAGAVYLPDRLHEVRIALKKLRYGLELALEAGGRGTRADLRLLKREQDLLGRLHDQQVLIDRVRRVQASLAPGDAHVWRGLDDLVRSLENSCRRLHARFVRGRARLTALCDRLEALGSVPSAAARQAG
jgi:CHAD domain-containing protein